ncbi:uncharacterized protein LOC126888533 [Diabrotica virgifera virgifera]|uniref:CRAL-TRIO domain-containing protein n=1 Tax=Diabrotica virgifera virgifera TaxID=50390 RepID=A0ABM5KRL7_DIAVI|nr:uncharacterized protein LOC126888533 [Diabrotica virgifera virgifera]
METKQLLQVDRELIRKKWGKTEGDVMKDILIIREWLKTQKHLPEVPSNNMIEFFLTNCKFSIEKTKKNLDMYYTIQTLLPELYQNCNPCAPEMDRVHDIVSFLCIPTLTPTLHRLTVIQYHDVDANDNDMKGILSLFLRVFHEIRMHEDLAMGEIYILDLERIKFSVISRLTPLLFKKVGFVFEKIHSSRMHALYFYKAPTLFHNALILFKSLLSKKLSDRVHSYQSMDEITKHIPIELLPCDYGGQQKSIKELQG